MKRLLLAILIAVSAAGCAQRNTYTTRDINEQLIMATLWMQTSAEYRALCYQAFNIARYNLDNYLASAASSKKPAIIVDADETIIDNSAYQAHLIGRDYGYSSKTWNAWMDAAKARAVPGAVEFLHYAQSKGVEVFYITNRKETGYTG
ncbi:MAG: 5'-nucleotidase, lipoprotein e(P4) family, partial [Spirochaetota bacterium]